MFISKFNVLAIGSGRFPENIETYALISGLFTSLYSAGAFIGPSLGGVLTQYVSFRSASLLPLTLEMSILIFSIAHFWNKREPFFAYSRNGYQPIE